MDGRPHGPPATSGVTKAADLMRRRPAAGGGEAETLENARRSPPLESGVNDRPCSSPASACWAWAFYGAAPSEIRPTAQASLESIQISNRVFCQIRKEKETDDV